MAFDEVLLEAAIQEKIPDIFLRFYVFNQKSITIGFAQRNSSFLEDIIAKGLPWVRRMTGGGMVVHDQDLIFSLILPVDSHSSFRTPGSTYQVVHECFHKALKNEYNITTTFRANCGGLTYVPKNMVCFEKPICDDLMLGAQKVIGGAQKRSRGYVLHQGAIQLAQLDLKDRQEALIHSVVKSFEQSLEWKSNHENMQPLWLLSAKELQKKKYSQTDWNLKAKK